ncbi:Ciliary neurotrophic factor receptor subunit alpha, partial [Nibea albiflora]
VARNQYERMGSDVTMQCGTLENDASVSWKVNGTDVKAQHRLEGPRLLLNEVDLGHNGLYSCFQNPHGERRDTIYLHIGIKPDPPERVTATPIRFNARRLEVSWHSPSTWPDIDNFPLKYFLRYRPLIREQWQHVELSDSTSHTITDAYAGKEYIIQVAAKDTEIGTWSDWSVAVHATPWIEDPLPITSTTEGDFSTETKTSPIPSSNAPQKAEPPVGRAARLLTFFSPLLLGMLLLFMW